MTALTDYDIWLVANNIDINFGFVAFAELGQIEKPLRQWSDLIDRRLLSGHERKRLSVKGNPTLSNVVTVMVGIRNPDKDLEQPLWTSDDGQTKCAELWVNELRLSGFNEEGGWAAVAQANATLADLANVECGCKHVGSRMGWIGTKSAGAAARDAAGS